MKRFLITGLVTLTLLLAAGKAVGAELAAPLSALFYPDEVYLTVEERLTPVDIPGKGSGLRLVLPGNAQRDTLSITVDGTPPMGFYWLDPHRGIRPLGMAESAVSGKDDTPVEKQALLDAVKALEKRLDANAAADKAGKTRIALWERANDGNEKFTSDDIIKLDAASAERLAAMYAADLANARERGELEEQYAKARSALEEYEVKHTRNVAVIPVSEKTPVTVRYSYLMPARTMTFHRLTAYPVRETLAVEQEVTLLQQSGNTWDNVEVYVSTARRDKSIRPRPLSPWVISLVDKNAPAESYSRAAAHEPAPTAQMVQMDKTMALRAENAPLPEPVQAERGTFRLWSLGKRTIASDAEITLPLAKDEYPAHYYYTLQPSMSPRGFLTASLDLENALELPQSNARLFVDDVAVGNTPLAINGTKATIYFGTDPQVSAVMRDLKRTAGEKGIISKEQTALWHWEITVRNTRGRAVEVRVQDPIPSERDTAIKLAVTSDPQPVKSATATQSGGTAVYEWQFILQPNESKTINHKVEVAAPADKILRTDRK